MFNGLPFSAAKRAERRMAQCVDAGQARGEIATKETYHGNQWNVPAGNTPPTTLPELHITRKRLHRLAQLSHIVAYIRLKELSRTGARDRPADCRPLLPLSDHI
jgi:hypothetical protein